MVINNETQEPVNGSNSNVYSIKQHEAIVSDEYNGHIISIPEDIVMVRRGIFNGEYRKIQTRRTPVDFWQILRGRQPNARQDRRGIIWVVFPRIVENHGFFGVKKGKAVYLVSKKVFTNDLDSFTKMTTIDKNKQTVNVDFSYKWRVVDPVKYIKCNAPEGEVLSFIQAFIDAYIKRNTYEGMTSGDLKHDSIRLDISSDYINTMVNGTAVRKKNIIKEIFKETIKEFGIEITSFEFQKILPDKKIVDEINNTKVVEEQMRQRKLKTERDVADIEALRKQGFNNDQIAKMRAINSDGTHVGIIMGDDSSLSTQIGAGIYAAGGSTQNIPPTNKPKRK